MKNTLLLAYAGAMLLIAVSCRKNINQPERNCVEKDLDCGNTGCPEYYDPVCGCNSKTYHNSCDAEVHGIKKWTKGACPGDEDTTK
jgi:hypothetical protein